MSEKIREISEKTLIPLSMLAVLAGGIVWLTNQYAMTAELAHRVDDLAKKQELDMELNRSIDHRLSRIEGKLGLNE